MAMLAIFSEEGDKGNVIPGLAIALLGVVANSIFWRKYTSLYRREANALLLVQSRLYRAKTLVDSCVTVALLTVLFLPTSPVSYWVDLVGSVIVAGYLAYSGGYTIYEAIRRVKSAGGR